jgi:poly(A) polymerase
MGSDQPVSEDELLRLLKLAAAEKGVRAWVVGGYVRDKLLGRAPINPDVVVEGGSALELAARFAELAAAPPPVMFERFGTAQVTLPDRLVEFVTARAESYAPDSRKPDVRQATLDEDLRRRDFTINTLVMDLEGKVHDPLGMGMADLDARILRTPAEPDKTFTDDPLRMLRAVRFAAQLGFEPAPDLPPAMRRMRERLAPPVVSVERIADELRKMLVAEQPRRAMELLDEGGLLEIVLPEVAACKGVAQGGYHTQDVFGHTLQAVGFTPPELLVRLAALFHDVGKPATATADGSFTGHEQVGADIARATLERLRFSQKEIDVVVLLVRLHLRPVYYRTEWSDGAVRRLARDAGAQLERLMALARADLAASAYPDPDKLDELETRIREVLSEKPSRLTSPVSGEDVMRALHLSPGPEVGRIKERLTELVLDGEIEPTREAVLAYLASHANP